MMISCRYLDMNVEKWSVWKSLKISMKGGRFNVLIGWTASPLRLWRKSRKEKALEMGTPITTLLLTSAVLNIVLFTRYGLGSRIPSIEYFPISNNLFVLCYYGVVQMFLHHRLLFGWPCRNLERTFFYHPL